MKMNSTSPPRQIPDWSGSTCKGRAQLQQTATLCFESACDGSRTGARRRAETWIDIVARYRALQVGFIPVDLSIAAALESARFSIPRAGASMDRRNPDLKCRHSTTRSLRGGGTAYRPSPKRLLLAQ